MKYTHIISYSVLLLSVTVSIATANDQQIAFGQPEIQIQNELNVLVDDLVQAESIATSCSSCISLLHVIKKMSYMPESFLINALTRVCKRTQKVDDEVVSLMLFSCLYANCSY
jgi:sphingomyelin phosphodiesterase